MSDSQSLGAQKESITQESIKFIVSVFKILIHGLIALFGFGLFFSYYFILEANLWLGNYIIFLPFLLILAIPLVLIILGALNSYSVRYIYHRKTHDSWPSLLIEGFLVVFTGFLFTVAWTALLVYFVGPQWPPFYYDFGWLFIIFYLLLIPSMGYVTKEIAIIFFTTKTQKKP
jgi:hypothetical protein